MQWSTQHPPVLSDVQAASTRPGSSSRSRSTTTSRPGRTTGRSARCSPGCRRWPHRRSCRPPASFSADRRTASPTPGCTTRCRTRSRPGSGRATSARTATTAELPDGDRPARAQHAHAGPAAAELRSRVDDERARRRGQDRPDPVPAQQHERAAADQRAQHGQGGVGLGDAALAEPGRHDDGLDAGHGPGLQRDAAVGRLLGLRRPGLGRPEAPARSR